MAPVHAHQFADHAVRSVTGRNAFAVARPSANLQETIDLELAGPERFALIFLFGLGGWIAFGLIGLLLRAAL